MGMFAQGGSISLAPPAFPVCAGDPKTIRTPKPLFPFSLWDPSPPPSTAFFPDAQFPMGAEGSKELPRCFPSGNPTNFHLKNPFFGSPGLPHHFSQWKSHSFPPQNPFFGSPGLFPSSCSLLCVLWQVLLQWRRFFFFLCLPRQILCRCNSSKTFDVLG